MVSLKIECGHWELDYVVGYKMGKDSVSFNITMNCLGKNIKRFFSKVFKTITTDNGIELRLKKH